MWWSSTRTVWEYTHMRLLHGYTLRFGNIHWNSSRNPPMNRTFSYSAMISSSERPGRPIPAHRIVLVNIWAEFCFWRSPPSLTRALSIPLNSIWGAVIRMSWSASSVLCPAPTTLCFILGYISALPSRWASSAGLVTAEPDWSIPSVFFYSHRLLPTLWASWWNAFYYRVASHFFISCCCRVRRQSFSAKCGADLSPRIFVT